MMKTKYIATVFTFGCLMSSANAVLLANGDFETDNLTGNNVVGPVTAWNGGANVRTDTDNPSIPATTTVVRLTGGVSIWQNFTTAWDAASTFTVDFNATNVPWKLGTEPGVWASLRSAAGVEYLAQLANTAQTHDGTSTYAAWTPGMTWSFDFAGSDLITAGATANEALRVNLFSKSPANSINWIDNVSVNVVPEPSSTALLGLGGLALIVRRRKF